MNIVKIELLNFRNYRKKTFDKFSNLNIIIGKNGVGKTSIIESIYIGSLAKSFKTNNDFTIIKKNADFFKIKIYCYDYPINKILELYYDKSGTKTKINSYSQKRLSDFISQYRVIMLCPEEVRIVKSSPAIRRNYLNIELSQLNKQYLRSLNNYNLLIKNKNEYLKKMQFLNISDTTYLDTLDEKIVDEGMIIYKCRSDYIEKINKYIDDKFKKFIKGSHIKLQYDSDFSIFDKNSLLKKLKENRPKEIKLGMTNFGIHRDDVLFLYNDYDAKEYCSQGVQKLIVLALKLSEIEIFINEYDIKPILLLDDLFSELDEKNRNNIFKLLDSNMQIFITTTDLKNINRNIINRAKIYNLDEIGR